MAGGRKTQQERIAAGYRPEILMSETAGFTFLEQGVYRALLDHYLVNGEFIMPDESAGVTEGDNLRYLCNLINAKSEDEQRATGKMVMTHFIREGQYLVHHRIILDRKEKALEEEYSRALNKTYANADHHDQYSIPFGETDDVMYWMPSDELIAKWRGDYRYCDVYIELSSAREYASRPTRRPAGKPDQWFEQWLDSMNRQKQEIMRSYGIDKMAWESKDFVRFASTYPRVKNMKGAWILWQVMRVDENQELVREIMNGLNRWLRCSEWAYTSNVPDPARFLSEEIYLSRPSAASYTSISREFDIAAQHLPDEDD